MTVTREPVSRSYVTPAEPHDDGLHVGALAVVAGCVVVGAVACFVLGALLAWFFSTVG